MTFEPQSIGAVATELGLRPDEIEPWGRQRAKLNFLERAPSGAGRLVLVSAINPTPAGEGKTTTAIALAMAMRRLGKRAVLALRQPSLGPIFGVKGGGTGGGRASLHPADDINVHLTGDMHAVSAAHNLLAALADNALFFREKLADGRELDARRLTWGRVVDMNDRSLRNIVIGLGGKGQGVPRETRFDITAASEVMAILALATSHRDLEERLARIIVGSAADGAPISARDLHAEGAMAALLRDALYPNLVQTAEGGPALVHAGPFGNIAHGCNSVIATKLALAMGDFAVTEAGFGFDLGGEKFLDIKAAIAGVWPRLVVLVATLRALRMHGGVPAKSAHLPNAAALERGLPHLAKHIENAARFGLPVVVAINRFAADPDDELARVRAAAVELGAVAEVHDGVMRGGEGALALAELVCERAAASDASPPAPRPLYDATLAAREKIRTIAREIYGATDIELDSGAETDLERAIAAGGATLPICMAKTQSSLSDDPTKVGRPEGFVLRVREVRLAAGAGFLVVLTGEMMTMPGLPRVPAARSIRLLPDGRIKGLMSGE